MTDTVVACLTPSAAGAIATLAVHGPDAWTICHALFTPRTGSLPERLEEATTDRFVLGLLGEGLRDQAVLALRRAEPVPWVELHCHGGVQMVEVLLEQFAKRGARVLSWRDWCEHVEVSALRAEAARQLALAPTVRTAGILLDQYHGAFEAELERIRRTIGEGDLAGAEKMLASCLRLAPVGRHLVRPWRVVVAGAPNVGKSSLVNALAGFQRAVVSEVPGTTRDVVTTQLALDGWPVELADTAGMRESSGVIEAEGIRLARAEAATADLCLWVLDASVPPSETQDVGGPVMVVINKNDLPAVWDLDQQAEAVRVSALTGAGLAELCDGVVRRLVPECPAPGAAVPFTQEWIGRLEETGRACAGGNAAGALEALTPGAAVSRP
jgi:tRNA modification GTPase